MSKRERERERESEKRYQSRHISQVQETSTLLTTQFEDLWSLRDLTAVTVVAVLDINPIKEFLAESLSKGMISTGMGNIIVEFFSVLIRVKVCKYRS